MRCPIFLKLSMGSVLLRVDGSASVSWFECVSGLSVHWPIIALERASAEWQSSAVNPQFNLSVSFVSRFSKHFIEFIAIDS